MSVINSRPLTRPDIDLSLQPCLQDKLRNKLRLRIKPQIKCSLGVVMGLWGTTMVMSLGSPLTTVMAFGFVPPPDNEAPRENSAGGAAAGPASIYTALDTTDAFSTWGAPPMARWPDSDSYATSA